MSDNCRVQLKGNLGNDAKVITSNNKEFVALNLATTDSYFDKQTSTWKNKETLWHDVLVFSPSALKFARDLKKGERVYIDGILSYKQVESKEGYKVTQASIIANFAVKAPLIEKGEEEETE
jgi:single-strand DNA-binding protein